MEHFGCLSRKLEQSHGFKALLREVTQVQEARYECHSGETFVTGNVIAMKAKVDVPTNYLDFVV